MVVPILISCRNRIDVSRMTWPVLILDSGA